MVDCDCLIVDWSLMFMETGELLMSMGDVNGCDCDWLMVADWLLMFMLLLSFLLLMLMSLFCFVACRLVVDVHGCLISGVIG